MIKKYFTLFILVSGIFNFCFAQQNALSLDGTNDYISSSQPGPTGTTSRTIECWIKTSFNGAQGVLVDWGATTPNGSRFTFNVLNTLLRIEVGGNGFTSTVSVADGNWHHVAVTYNNSNATGTKAKLYIDGVLNASADFTVTVNTLTTTNIRIGARVDGTGFFNGSIDEIRVWNVERTAAQILASKNSEFCSLPTGLIAYFKCNQGNAGGTNTSITNLTNTASAQNGTFNGLALTGATSNFVAGPTALAMLGSTSSTISASACSSYTSPDNNTYTTSGVYHDTIPNAAGCDSLITINLTIGVSPVTGLAATGITSSAANLNWTAVSGATGYQYVLDQTAGNPSGAGTAITPNTYAASGLNPASTYYMHVRSSCGTNFSAWTTISFTTLCVPPSITSFADSFRCGAGTVVLKATTTSGASIKWYAASTGGTALATGNSFTTPVLSVTTNYYITAISGTCESSPRQQVVAQIRTIPTVNIGNDTTICPGISYTFNAGNPGGSYLWTPGGETTQTITKNAVGQYTVIVTVNQCSKRDTILITPGSAPVNNLSDSVNLCQGDTTTLNAGNTGSTFVWSPGGATTQSINVNAGGTYSVNVKSIHGCKLTSNSYIKMRPLPVNNLGNDTVYCSSVSLLLDAGNAGGSYNWNTGAVTQTIQSADSGKYKVTVTTPYNCVSSDSIHIAFLPAPATEGFSFVPKFYEELGKVSFTPLNPTDIISYEWNFGDDSPVSTSMNPTHVYAASGEFEVILKVYNTCSDDTVKQKINVELPTGGITISKNNINLMIYPNPANALLNISNNSQDYQMQDVMIFNTVGAMVYHHKADSKTTHQLSVAQFTSGIYFVRVLTDKGFVNQQIQIVK